MINDYCLGHWLTHTQADLIDKTELIALKFFIAI